MVKPNHWFKFLKYIGFAHISLKHVWKQPSIF